jgi:hypothetical protein
MPVVAERRIARDGQVRLDPGNTTRAVKLMLRAVLPPQRSPERE